MAVHPFHTVLTSDGDSTTLRGRRYLAGATQATARNQADKLITHRGIPRWDGAEKRVEGEEFSRLSHKPE